MEGGLKKFNINGWVRHDGGGGWLDLKMQVAGGAWVGTVHIKVILVPQKMLKAVRRGCNQNP